MTFINSIVNIFNSGRLKKIEHFKKNPFAELQPYVGTLKHISLLFLKVFSRNRSYRIKRGKPL